MNRLPVQDAQRVLIVGGDSAIGRALEAEYQSTDAVVTKTTRRTDCPDRALHLEIELPVNIQSLGPNMWDILWFCPGVPMVETVIGYEFTAAAIEVLRKLALRVEPGGKLVVLTSHMSCPTYAAASGAAAESLALKYRHWVASKAALNTGCAILSTEHRHCRWILAHPGHVHSRTTGYSGRQVSPETSARGLRAEVNNTLPYGPLALIDYRGHNIRF